MISAITVIADPFDKPVQFSYAERALFWPLLVGLAILVGKACRFWVHEYVRPRIFALRVLLIAVVVSAALTPLIVLELSIFAKDYVPTTDRVAMIAFYVLLVSIGVSVLRRLTLGAPHQVNDVPDTAPRLFDRIEPEKHGTLLRMQVRDHYVDVVTSQGQASLLIRFSDAIAEVDPVPGCRVHRSHWVAVSAVTGSHSANKKCWISTVDGAEVPVSRTYRADAVAAGILPCRAQRA